MTTDQIIKSVEEKTKAGTLTELERAMFTALLRAGNSVKNMQATLDKIDKALAERGIES